MTKDELDKALAEYKHATREEARLLNAYNQARNEDSELMQAEKECEELEKKCCRATKTWKELNNRFNKNHKSLLESLEVACAERREAVDNIDFTYSHITGVEDEW